jgi:hypothetical protein
VRIAPFDKLRVCDGQGPSCVRVNEQRPYEYNNRSFAALRMTEKEES